MMWFETLTGFLEISPQQVHTNVTVDGRYRAIYQATETRHGKYLASDRDTGWD
ncbi:MAG: hypothetical protein HN590_15545 [Calditrichaeota bacterium]|jgi:hypothetical protein|nr:hypothetical protein [Calditrichota bacterium]